jgi:eukaryotic-like serine/threonine-protein kinase
VSSKGELAVLISKSKVPGTGPGVLARVPIAGGAPREILEEVVEADWAPNGEDFAVIVAMPNGKRQLQYPIGTVLAEGDDFGNIRVSPNGDLIACNEGGTITTYDRKGKRSDILLKMPRMDGLAWSPRGDEILFVGGPSERQIALRAVSLSGRDRVLLPFALGLVLHDVAFDGRLLMEKRTFRGEIACQPRGENRERELGRPPQPWPTLISEDGKFLLFSIGVEDEGIYFQQTEGSPPVRLGEGNAVGLSSDGRWVLTLLVGPPRELVMIPTGAGNSKKIPVEGIEPKWAWLLPNGKGIMVQAPDKAGNPLVVVGPEGGKPTPVRADEYTDRAMALSPDGDRFVYSTKAGQLRIAALSGGEPTTVPGAPLMVEDHLAQWSADGRFLYIWRSVEIPGVIDRLELATGRRELWKKIAPQDSTGVRGVSNVVMAPDGESYAYQYYRVVAADLYVVEGVK